VNHPSTDSAWGQRADRLQGSIGALYGAPWPQYLHNTVPFAEGDDATFNYWWLAHLMDCRLDAYERSGDEQWLDEARTVHRNIVERNAGSLFNDYFDDMLWFALATLRLAELGGEQRYEDDAVALWDHVVEHGWNDAHGPSLAWRKQQLEYKNTPANAPLAILGARLHRRTGKSDYLETAWAALDWLSRTLRRPDGFVEDGINRVGDGQIDVQWRFTYNQGVYVGAVLELEPYVDGRVALGDAVQTARVAIEQLSDGSVFYDEGPDGDEGLFKGIFYRYAALLAARLPVGSADRELLDGFLRRSTDALWSAGLAGQDDSAGALLAGNDWSTPPSGRVYYSTELSALMATEQRAALESAPQR
jgi:predicted alpha-1,6-mannanase (GH76 family)